MGGDRLGASGPEFVGWHDAWAEIYDEWNPQFDEAMIATLAELARGGRALELGIGTGRIALRLAARGVEVHGIDVSPAMVARLRAKPGGATLPVAIGDMADVGVEGRFSVVYVVFNTFFLLPTQEAQVRCFRNAAEHLTEDGVFIVEAFVPSSEETTTLEAEVVEAREVLLKAYRHDRLHQRVAWQYLVIRESGIRLYPVELRYAWPAELDLMARLAGLRLRHRWTNWKGEPFTSDSGWQVAIYERDPGTRG